MPATRFDTRSYTASHGKSPRGFGGWMFDFGNGPENAPGAQHYGTARQWARMEARRRGVSTVTVCP